MIQADIKRLPQLTGGFALLMIIIKLFSKIPLPNIILLIVSIIFLFNIFNLFLFPRLKKKNINILLNYYFGFKLFEISWLTILIYFTGGISWIVPLFYSFIIVNIFWVFPKNKAVFLIGYCNLILIFLILLQYFKILPDFYLFSPEDKNLQNLSYVSLTIIAGVAVLIYLGYSSNIFYKLLQAKIINLKKTREKFEETKRNLEAEIRKRTRELLQEKKKLEIIVRERTKELETRRKIVQERVKELEKSHRLAVARELRMSELKEELENFKKLTKKS